MQIAQENIQDTLGMRVYEVGPQKYKARSPYVQTGNNKQLQTSHCAQKYNHS